MKNIFITGGGGFIGSHLTRQLLIKGYSVTVFDNFDPQTTNKTTLNDIRTDIEIIEGNILDSQSIEKALNSKYDAIIHCAAIAAVDRSIREPLYTINVNTVGTANTLYAANKIGVKRFHYISTDEVFGHLYDGAFDENSPISPRNPYSAGKAGGELAALAWAETYGLNLTITNACNNYGSYQSPDKLIPRLTIKALKEEKLPVYGSGEQQREWIHVDDHASAVITVLEKGKKGQRYCVGSSNIKKNIDVVKEICNLVNLDPQDSIEFVKDRPGHDIRYYTDCAKIQKLGWMPQIDFSIGLRETIEWYKNNKEWWKYFDTKIITSKELFESK